MLFRSIKADPQYEGCNAVLEHRIVEASIPVELLGDTQFPWVTPPVTKTEGDTTGIGG